MADKTFFSIIVAGVFAAGLLGCNEQKTTAGSLSRNSAPSVHGREQVTDKADSAQELYWGEEPAPRGGREGAKTADAAGSNGGKPEAGSVGAPADRDAPAGGGSVYALVLGTFTEGDHEFAAREMISGLRSIAPEAAQRAWTHTTPKGTMVVYGRYADREDATARADQERLKAVQYKGRPVFNRVILTRVDLRLTSGQLHQFDLLSARRQYPTIDPLYTLDVAVWDDFESGKLSPEEVRQQAERYAAQLRAQGHQAYFYHDEGAKRSVVTVGLFDRRAIHPRSGFFSPEVEELMAKFPERLVNGEPLLELKNRFDPKAGTAPQKPLLVLVPTM